MDSIKQYKQALASIELDKDRLNEELDFLEENIELEITMKLTQREKLLLWLYFGKGNERRNAR